MMFLLMSRNILESNDGDDCEFSTPESGRAFQLNCGFNWLVNHGPNVAIKINSKEYNEPTLQFKNGSYTRNGLEISFQGEKLKMSNRIDITISIRNTNSNISNYSISNSFDTFFGNRIHKASGLSGFRGWRGFDDSHSVCILFNNSRTVTPVNYASFGNSVLFGRQDPIDDKTIFGNSLGVSFSWVDKKISLEEVQKIKYSINIGDCFPGYKIDVKTTIEEIYSPGSIIILDIDVLNNYIDDHLKINRCIDSKSATTIYFKDDNGDHFKIKDNITLPTEPGDHTIKYITENDASLTFEKIIRVKIKSNPQISIVQNLKMYYNANENITVIAKVFDEKSVTLKIIIDNETILRTSVDCNGNYVTKNVDFQIPNGDSGTTHTIKIFCVDMFGVSSIIINYQYILNSKSIATNNMRFYIFDIKNRYSNRNKRR